MDINLEQNIFSLPNEILYNIAHMCNIKDVLMFMAASKYAREVFTNVFGALNCAQVRLFGCDHCLTIGPDVAYGKCTNCYIYCKRCGIMHHRPLKIYWRLTCLDCHFKCISCNGMTNYVMRKYNGYIVCVDCITKRGLPLSDYSDFNYDTDDLTTEDIRKHLKILHEYAKSNPDKIIFINNNRDTRKVNFVDLIDGHYIPQYVTKDKIENKSVRRRMGRGMKGMRRKKVIKN
jgi:hypothetical protein